MSQVERDGADLTEEEKLYVEKIWKAIFDAGRLYGHKMDRETLRNMNPWGHISWTGSSFYSMSKFMAQCKRCKCIIQAEFRDKLPYRIEPSLYVCEFFGSMK